MIRALHKLHSFIAESENVQLLEDIREVLLG